VKVFGAPVIIAQGAVVWIDGPGKDAFGAFLDTAETTHAGIQVLGLLHGAAVQNIFLEDIVDALFLHTLFAGAGAVFPEFDGRIFADGMEPWRSGGCVDMVLFGHELLQAGIDSQGFTCMKT
jgi:hypothetical protein